MFLLPNICYCRLLIVENIKRIHNARFKRLYKQKRNNSHFHSDASVGDPVFMYRIQVNGTSWRNVLTVKCLYKHVTSFTSHNTTAPQFATLPFSSNCPFFTDDQLNHHLWHDSPLRGQPSLEIKAAGYFTFGIPDNRIFTGWGCQPHTQPPIWRTRPPYLWPPERE
jgi:hypothetical protein